MWRSKLYCDVRIHLDDDFLGDDNSDSSESSAGSLSSTAIFTAHRFMLVSRSPYFASLLLNPAFRPHTADIHLPTPPFSPAALHFCLGYIYAGHLDFSNRSFDLMTAFQIYRAATYLQMDPLRAEVESRIVHDFCHGMAWSKCHCRQCLLRSSRVWLFAIADDIGNIPLAKRARTIVVRGWAESWGRDIGLCSMKDRQGLVRDVINATGPDTVIATFRSLTTLRARLEYAIRTKGRGATMWVEQVEAMANTIGKHAKDVLVDHFESVASSTALWELVLGQGFSGDLLKEVTGVVVEGVGTAGGCVDAPRVYQVGGYSRFDVSSARLWSLQYSFALTRRHSKWLYRLDRPAALFWNTPRIVSLAHIKTALDADP